MALTPCPGCGHSTTDAAACPNCGRTLANGTPQAVPAGTPPEVSGWTFYPTPPEIHDEMRRTFNEAEFLAELREAERAGLPEFKDLVHKLEQDMNASG